jgi:dihydrofolate reductase
MRKLIFSINMTLDGFIAGPHDELDWTVADDELHDFFADLLSSCDLIIFGRVIYDMMVSYWPKAPSDAAMTAGMLRFAAALNPMKKIVYSSTLKDVGWNTKLRKSFDPDEIWKLKEEAGRPILLDGTSLLPQFMEHGLVDELQLVVMPVVIGAGKPLFARSPQPYKLIYQWSKPFASGAVALCYRPDGNL